MEIPDSDEDEEILLPTPEKKHDDSYQETNSRSKTKSTTQFIERILTQLNIASIQNQHQNQHQQDQDQDQGRDYVQGNKQNPLSALPPSALSQAKPLLLTLHCLLPNELLPALDILDRGLAKKISRRKENDDDDDDDDSDGAEPEPEPPSLARPTDESPKEDIFFVLSDSEHEKKGHEVRLQAWNCTCASFLSSAFPPDPDSDSDPDSDPDSDHDIDIGSLGGLENCRLGGTLTRGLGQSSPPICKHILACVLLVRCPGLFTSSSQTWLVSTEELAAWCAGWGD